MKIFIVTGPGYSGYETFRREVVGDSDVDLTHATGVISRIMEKVQLAITSNGRTVYELAHLSIPAIVIPQHERVFRFDKNKKKVVSRISRLFDS